MMVVHVFISLSRFHIALQSKNDGSLRVYFTVQIPPIITGLAVHAGEECRATAKVTLNLQVVLSDMKATSEP